MTINYTYNESDKGESVAVYVNGSLKVADDSHPRFREILSHVRNGRDPSHLFDIVSEVRNAVSKYSRLVTVDAHNVYFDGEPVRGGIANKILEVLNAGLDAKPYVRFLENVWSNPSHRSREQLFTYLDNHGFQITEDGCFISYKGLTKEGKSVHSGTAFVDGVRVTGQIPNVEGSVITMLRSSVSDDPNVPCHQGLHAGAWGYASSFGLGVTAKVKINPMDVVSVPADSNVQKLRTCKYTVLELTDEELDYEESPYYDYNLGYEEGFADGQESANRGEYI